VNAESRHGDEQETLQGENQQFVEVEVFRRGEPGGIVVNF
jgi:hypothetical protein